MVGLVLVMAMIGQPGAGQVVSLGRPGGLEPDAPADVAATVKALAEYTAAKWKSPEWGSDVCMLGFGTRAKILEPVTLSCLVDGAPKREPGFKIRIVDGPLAGVTGFVRANGIHEGDGDERLPTPIPGSPGKNAEEVELASLGADGNRMPVFGASSPREVAAFLDALDVSNKTGARMTVPSSVVTLGDRVKAKVISAVEIPPTRTRTEPLDGLLVQVSEGLAKGCNLIVPKDFVDQDGPVVEAEGAPAKTMSPSLSERRKAELAETIRRQKERRSARFRSGRQREAEMAEEARAAAAKAEADFKAALPFLLENQRQQLQRMSAVERNAALMKMADADKRIADAIQYRVFVQGR